MRVDLPRLTILVALWTALFNYAVCKPTLPDFLPHKLSIVSHVPSMRGPSFLQQPHKRTPSLLEVIEVRPHRPPLEDPKINPTKTFAGLIDAITQSFCVEQLGKVSVGAAKVQPLDCPAGWLPMHPSSPTRHTSGASEIALFFHERQGPRNPLYHTAETDNPGHL
jgi:hypothetical protein